MNIIISGVNGFIGSELLTLLRTKEEYKPIGTGRKNNDTPGSYYNADLTNKDSVRQLIQKIRSENLTVDCFVHCASVLADARNHNDMELFDMNNRITEHVILLIKELKIKTLINLSTIGVYPNMDGEYDECSAVNPSKNFECLYSLAKFSSEELFDFYLSAPEYNVINLRLSQVYGAGMREDRIFKIMENEMKVSGKITVWGNGERVSNFVNIEYVLKTIFHFIKHPVSGLFNVGGKNMSYKQLAEKIIKMNKADGTEICFVDKGVRSKVYINSDKLKKILAKI